MLITGRHLAGPEALAWGWANRVWPLLMPDGYAVGTLCVFDHTPRNLRPEQTRALEGLARQVVSQLELRRFSEEAQQQSRQLAAVNAQLEDASRHKSAFVANMSHELRTPLNAIIGYSEMLSEECEELGVEDLAPDLGKINGAGKHLLSLINSILDLSKIEAGKMDLYLEEFDLATLVTEVEAVVRPLIAKHGNSLRIRIGGEPGRMYADQTKVRQCFFNLLSNAAKFTDRGAITLDVRWEPGDAGEWVDFAVTDTGIGLTDEQCAGLFQAFSQAKTGTSRRFGGTGLGLALSRSFCQMMGGDIAVASTAGEGSTFTINLPALVTAPPSALEPSPTRNGT